MVEHLRLEFDFVVAYESNIERHKNVVRFDGVALSVIGLLEGLWYLTGQLVLGPLQD